MIVLAIAKVWPYVLSQVLWRYWPHRHWKLDYCRKKICSIGPPDDDDRLFFYIDVVSYLLSTYATDYIVVCTIKELEFYNQAPGVFAVL